MKAPGRVNLIGEHVDYQDGLVMPAAIDRHVIATARSIAEPEVRLSSSESLPEVVVPLEHKTPFSGDQSWVNYPFGVVAKYREAEYSVGGLEVRFKSDLPVGAGLSSSAALESATALVIEGMLGIELSSTERALLCQSAEHDWAGVPCGIMDQLAVNAGVAGHALRIDCRTLEIVPAPLPADLAIVVVDSKVRHALADGEYAKRKTDCETAAGILKMDTLRDADAEQLDAAAKALGDRVRRRARHVITEIARVQAFAKALDVGDKAAAGELMAASHASLRDDYEVSCTELDALVEIACDLGAVGARMTGGGFGGCTVNLVDASAAPIFADQVVARYRDQFGTEVEAWVVKLVAGAGMKEAF